MNEGNKFALVPRPSSAVEKPKLGKERILSGMVADTLALVKKELRPKHRILLVDDEADTIRLLESVICDWFKEATVLTFQDGDKAWQELQREDPDILITDLIRPGSMNGWEMISMLAERKVKYPIVLLTGRTKVPGPVKEMYQQGKMTSEEFMYEVMHTPADDVQDLLRRVSPPLNITFLGKPFENEELLKVLKACLEKGKMPRKSRPLKIVMVNDEEGVLRSFELVIQRWFKDVTMLFFDNGAAALDELLRTDPDLLITDDTMPVMSGGELCQRLFERRVTYPIIVDSAWEPTEQWVRELANQGLNVSFLPVPCDVESILKAVETALKIQRVTIEKSVETAPQSRNERAPRIVVVDDDSQTRNLYKEALRDWVKDATIMEFENGDEARRELLREAPDFLISDLVHVGMDGFTMLRFLAERKVKYPILIASGNVPSMEAEARECAGPHLNVTFLEKPFAIKTFRTAVEAALQIPARRAP